MFSEEDPVQASIVGTDATHPDVGGSRDGFRAPGRMGSPLGRGTRGEWRTELRQRPPASHAWPIEIAFLTHYGVTPGVLSAAVTSAKQQGVSADAALLAQGNISEYHFYRSLARHLRLPFVDGPAAIGADARYPQAVHAAMAPVAGCSDPAVLAAPRGSAITNLILAAYRGELRSRLALTTPTHFSKLLRATFRRQILHDASFALPALDPALSAKGLRWQQRAGAGAGIFVLALCAVLDVAGSTPLFIIGFSLVFLAMVLLRILACAASFEVIRHRRRPVADKDLPVYSIVIALYHEARVVPQLLAALDKIDYPPAKLEIKFVIEEDDGATRQALSRSVRGPMQEIIIAPHSALRTKPRALNVALPLLRGQFVVVFDAEDIPAPEQIRTAAERFAQAPPRLACLQARLAIHNLDRGWLPQLFAIEYAALFDVINIGLGDLGLPFPLGGSSNHFRTDILRKLCGWDAWNVTEDADIGFRLARFGYRTETLASSTLEEAPATLQGFLGQRRRWCKGWYQTLGTLCHDPRRVLRQVGLARGISMLLVLLSNVLAPLCAPLAALCLGFAAIRHGLSWPSTILEIGATTLWSSVLLGGSGAVLGPILLGMKRRGLLSLWPKLLLLPAYYALISFAAWTGLYELVVRPYHWCKTEHGGSGISAEAAGPPAH
ncbi:MAG: glycosyltransferase family 2 protein [Methylovirgula sp.]